MMDSNGNADSPSASAIAIIDPNDDDDIRRCSIGSASSLMAENNNNNGGGGGGGGGAAGAGGNNNNNNQGGMQHQLSVPGTIAGGQLARQLSIRRVSDISHINELRRWVRKRTGSFMAFSSLFSSRTMCVCLPGKQGNGL